MTGMRILQLCNKPPLPAVDGGCLAMHSITEGLLQAGIDVRVIAPETHKHPFLREQVPASYIEATHFETVPVNTEIRVADALVHLLKNKSYNLSRFYSAALERRLEEILAAETFDIIHVESLYMTPYLPVLRKNSKAKIVLRAHNIEHRLWERSAEVEKNPLKKTYLKKLAAQLKKAEADVLHRVDGLVPITPEDAAVFRAMSREKIPMHVLPYAMQLPELIAGKKTDPHSLCHIGSMDWAPNIAGISWFLQHCWKDILAKIPDANFHLAGKSLQKDDSRYQAENVTVHGEVKNAHAFMADYPVMAVPLVSGGGMRVKLIEAMALGKAIVTTTLGAEGTGIVNGTHALLADSPAGFSEAVIRLLEAPELAAELSKNARHLAETEFEISNATQKLLAFYRSLNA